MTFSQAYRSARSLEAVANYALADAPFEENTEDQQTTEDWPEMMVEDGAFWESTLKHPDGNWGRTWSLYRFGLSEWVPRVPGLYWTEQARILRLNAQPYEYQSTVSIPKYPDGTSWGEEVFGSKHLSEEWRMFHPPGKSHKVLGGVGTFKLPPDAEGRRLVTLTAGFNASSGIPALIPPTIWDRMRLREGHILECNATWQPMSATWAEFFPSTKGIPRGYLVLDDSRPIHLYATDAPVQFHPCTVMEYSDGDAQLYDFVYATADTRKPDWRQSLESFFDWYKEDKERYGRYLLSADIGNPMWDSEFDSPKQLRNSLSVAEAQLDLLEARILNMRKGFDGKTLDEILQVLAGSFTTEDIKRLSTMIGIKASQWSSVGTHAEVAAQFLARCVEEKKVELLVDAIVRDNPTLLDASSNG